jgi:hypothetical protein
MTGRIVSTRLNGGTIKSDDRGPLVRFYWKDCSDPTVNPSSVGHGTCVEFSAVIFGGCKFAKNVRRYIFCVRRLSEVIAEGQRTKQIATRGQPKKEMSNDSTLLLEQVGIDKYTSHRSQALAALPAKTAPRAPRGYANMRGRY